MLRPQRCMPFSPGSGSPAEGGGVGKGCGTRSMLQLAGAGRWPGPFCLCGAAGSAAGMAGSWLRLELRAGLMWGAC